MVPELHVNSCIDNASCCCLDPVFLQIAKEGARGRAGNNLSSHPAVRWEGLEETGLSGATKSMWKLHRWGLDASIVSACSGTIRRSQVPLYSY